jgi:hypothetical protein
MISDGSLAAEKDDYPQRIAEFHHECTHKAGKRFKKGSQYRVKVAGHSGSLHSRYRNPQLLTVRTNRLARESERKFIQRNVAIRQ